MSPREVHGCQCSICQGEAGHPQKGLHQQMNLFMSRLDEQQRRWYAGLESRRMGHGGIRLVALITGLDEHTIIRGRAELDTTFNDRPIARIRLPGGGRQRIEHKEPLLEQELLAMVESETAGDPMGERKWTRRSLRKITHMLRERGHEVSPPTISRLLRKHGYSMKGNRKDREPTASHPERDTQFQHMNELKNEFQEAGQPIISVDTKKKS